MPNIIAHIVGMDDITKNKFKKMLPQNISVFDMDSLQQKIYNNKDLRDAKQQWSDCSNKINAMNGQKRLLQKNGIKYDSLASDIRDMMKMRNQIKNNIYDIWKKAFYDEIKKFNAQSNKNILYIGFNIYAKDYRQKVNLPIDNFNMTINGKEYSNHIILETSATLFATNQISHYLDKYRSKIIAGTLPLYLLDREYLKSRYDKFFTYYMNQGYQRFPMDTNDNLGQLVEYIIDLEKLIDTNNRSIFYPTVFGANTNGEGTLPVSKAIQGFATRDEAMKHIRTAMSTITAPIHLYELRGGAFRNINGKYIASGVNEIQILNEEVFIGESNDNTDSTINKLLNAISISDNI